MEEGKKVRKKKKISIQGVYTPVHCYRYTEDRFSDSRTVPSSIMTRYLHQCSWIISHSIGTRWWCVLLDCEKTRRQAKAHGGWHIHMQVFYL